MDGAGIILYSHWENSSQQSKIPAGKGQPDHEDLPRIEVRSSPSLLVKKPKETENGGIIRSNAKNWRTSTL